MNSLLDSRFAADATQINRPTDEPCVGLTRQEGASRDSRYAVHSCATDRAEAQRYCTRTASA